LAPEVAPGATGNSRNADSLKTMLRQGGLEYPEPQGALNGVLYHWMPRLITAPLVVQELAQRHFFNALSFAVTFLSFVIAWGVLGTEASRPLISLGYFVFGGVVLLKPLVSGGRARMSTGSLVGLTAVAVVGPVLAGWASRGITAAGLSLQGQTFFMLVAALLAVGMILLALLAQLDGPPATERSCEQLTLSMNGPPAALITELDRKLQDQWVEKIPNRRYTRLEPDTQGAAGSGRFAGELLEETQPMPMSGTQAHTVASAFAAPRHRWLVVLDVYGTVLAVAGAFFALRYVRQFDPAELLTPLQGEHGLVGYALICMVVSAFCFQSASRIWGRFNFESELLWVELLGTWQSSRIGTGNQLSSRLQTQNDVVRIESMTLRIWRARVESVVFDKDSVRQVTAMFSTSDQARQLAAELSSFAGAQSVFVAPGAQEDQRRLAALQATENLLGGTTATPALGASPTAGQAHEALRVAASHSAAAAGAARFCTACGTPAPEGSRFCGQCGQALG
jgi:hypothetical protein